MSSIVAGVFIAPAALAIPAFPGAEGFGASASGGRGGEVFHVVNTLNTSTGTYEGPNGYNRGTLRWCLLTESSTAPRTVVFDVSGQVTLSSQITLENPNLTIAGQTAPGQGMSTAGKPWLVESGGNLVIRYIRNRLGRNGGVDSMGVEGGSNMIFDHVTSTWSNDEALSVAKTGNLVTVQNSFIYEGLNHSGHGYGSLIRPDIDSKITYHHNLYANNESRNPRPGTYNSKTLEFDFRNNVVYNWGNRAGYSGGSSEGNPEHVNMNFVGNYVIAGPSTYNNATSAFITDVNADLHAYQSGNLIDSDNDLQRDGVDTGWGMFEVEAGALSQVANPFPLAPVPVTTQSAADAYDDVLDYGGSFWWNRDTADARIVNQVRTQTGAIIDLESEVGGNPVLPNLTRAVDWDTDHDGMPNFWEVAHGLNANLASDRNNDFDTDGYTNLEEYINEAGAWPAPRAITWSGGSGRYALNANWDTWQPSHFDEVHVDAGAPIVDAIGQHARTVKIGTHPGDNAALNVTGGWLMVEDSVVIGADNAATATLNLSGGVLDTPLLSKGANGAFNFTGGTLHADTVDFSLVNNGGTLAPGHSPGTTEIMGDLTLNSGVLEIEIGGNAPGQYDRLEVHGTTQLGGMLRVRLVDLGTGTFVPQLGDVFGFLAAFGGAGDMFDSFDLPGLSPGLQWAIQPGNVTVFLTVVSAAPLPGDYNNNGVIDAADYTVWRDHLGSNFALANETASFGVVDLEDYNVWKSNFGAMAGNGADSIGDQAVPEPTCLVLLSMLMSTTLTAVRSCRIRSMQPA